MRSVDSNENINWHFYINFLVKMPVLLCILISSHCQIFTLVSTWWGLGSRRELGEKGGAGAIEPEREICCIMLELHDLTYTNRSFPIDFWIHQEDLLTSNQLDCQSRCWPEARFWFNVCVSSLEYRVSSCWMLQLAHELHPVPCVLRQGGILWQESSCKSLHGFSVSVTISIFHTGD